MRLLAKVIVVVVLVLLVPPTVLVGCAALDSWDVREARQEAGSELTGAFPEGPHLAEENRALLRKKASLHFETPVYASEELICLMRPDDRGWVTDSYSQQCFIWTVEVFAGESSRRRCDYHYFRGSADPDSRSSGSVLRLWSSELNAQSWVQRCGPFGFSDVEVRSVQLSGARPFDAPPGVTWTVLSVATPVSSTVVGCLPWQLFDLFCEPPGPPNIPGMDETTLQVDLL